MTDRARGLPPMGHDGRRNRLRPAIVEQTGAGAEAPERRAPPVPPGSLALDDFVVEIWSKVV